MSVRRNGFATAAWNLLIDYLLWNNTSDTYTQTWYGNIRLINLAHKLGFEECNRNINERFVRGELYDDVTFKLNLQKYKEFIDMI